MSETDKRIDMIEASIRRSADRERFKRGKTIKRRGFFGIDHFDSAIAYRAKKAIELVIEAKLLLTTDEEEEIFDFAVCYTEPLDGMSPKERKEFENKPIIYSWEEFSRQIGAEITDLLIQTRRHGRIKVTIINDGPTLDEQEEFINELDPWYKSSEGRKQIEIFLRKERGHTEE